MNSTIPTSRSIPVEIPEAEFKKMGYELIDRIAALNSQMRKRPVTTAPSSEQLQELLYQQVPFPEEGQDPGELLQRAGEWLMQHSLYNGHPRFWGYITSGPTPIGVLGDLLASAVNANVGAWVLSPLATEIEKQTVEWIARFMGYPAGGGLFTSGGNAANHIGFLAALRAKTGQGIRTKGIHGYEKKLMAYCSQETHTWIQKSADLSGLGTDHIRWVQADGQGRMNLAVLEAAVRKDLESGYQPFLVVGTAGSVSTGMVDELDRIGGICKKYDLWFHVDGAYGVLAAALPELKGLFAGLASVDSLAVDPHKWLYAPLEAGCTLVKDPKYLTDTFSYRPPYYNFEQAELNFVDYGPQNSRGFRALKVWLSFQHIGAQGHRQMIREDIELARHAYELLGGSPHFEVFSTNLSVTCFRYVPPGLKRRLGKQKTESYLNKLNQVILNRIERSGEYFISKAIIDGKFALRLCIVNFRTIRADVDAFPDFVRRLGEEVQEEIAAASKA